MNGVKPCFLANAICCSSFCRFVSIEPSKDFPSEDQICTVNRRWSWEKDKPETKREVPGLAKFCVHVPKDLLKKMVKEVDDPLMNLLTRGGV